MTCSEIEHMVAVWQQRLNLGHWDIRVRWERPVEMGSHAEIKISDDYEQASIRIQQETDLESDHQTRGVHLWDRRYANLTVVHELLHIYEKMTRRPVEAIGATMPAANKAYEVAWAWYDHGAENWIDRLSVVLVDLAGEV